MDFVRSYFFTNKTLGIWTYLSSLLGGFAVAPAQKLWKKCLTAQSFIRKEVTSYKIHTLVALHMYDNDLHATCFLYVKERNNDLKIRRSVFSKKQWLVKTGSSF